MLLSSFVAGLDGQADLHCRFQMSTVDQALGIAVTVFEAETQQKEIWLSFQIEKPITKLAVTLVSTGTPLEIKVHASW
jgi:hypothetical protein